MSQNRPILTISILVSGREDTTEKCLDSLRPLMQAIPSELILTDTGCSASFRRKLSDYTDSILPFAWCGDFSAARNIGLQNAQGEWFLYIDDDEWFADVAPIIDFFRSGRYRGYHQAVYKQRNYRNAAGTEYQDIWVSRMIRRDKDTRFSGKVHEVLGPVAGKTASIDCYVHHFGYVFETEAKRQAHAKRNISLLREMMQKEPEEMRWPMHLLKEYDMLHDFESFDKVARGALARLKGQRDALSCLQRGMFQTAVLMADLELGRYDALLKNGKDYEKEAKNNDYVKCSLYKLMATGAQISNRPELAESYARQYFEALEAWQSNPRDEQTQILEESIIYLRDNVSEQMVNFMRALWATMLIFMNRTADFPEKHRRAYQEYLTQQIKSESWQIPQYVRLMEQAGLVTVSEQAQDRPVLTISLLISNRPETIRQCLDSLKPIMEQIKSELILVDTSGEPKIREILSEYTDQVIPFTWINDFSAARNVGLSHAHGEWFLYLDDDEWFVETDELIDFFRSGEYRSYHRADYIQRNFLDGLLTFYSDNWVSRMVRIEEDTHFESRIHEYMAPARGRRKKLKIIANHTGYIFPNEEDKIRHFERNSVLLKEMIREEPNRMRWKVQLAQEFRSVKRWDEMYQFCMSCLEVTARIDVPGFNRDIGTFYVGAVESLLFLDRCDEAEAVADRGLSDKRMSRLCKSHLHLQLGVARYRKGKWDASEKALMQYFDDYAYMQAHEEELESQQGALLVDEAFDDVAIKRAYSILICDGLKQKDTTALKRYYEKLEWGRKVIYVCDDLTPVLLEALSTLPLEDIFVQVWRDAWKNTDLINSFSDFIDEKQRNDETAFYHMMRLVSAGDVEDPHTLYANISLALKDGNSDALDAFLSGKRRSFLESAIPGVLGQFGGNLLRALDGVLKKGDPSPEGGAEETTTCGRAEKEEGPCCRIFRIYLRQALLVAEGGELEYHELREAFEGFAGETTAFIDEYYQPCIRREYPELLPEYGKAASEISRALQLERHDPSAAMKHYRKVVDIDNRYAEVISAYMRMFGSYQDELRRKEEFEELKKKVFEEVQGHIRNRRYDTAYAILSELKRTSPDDLEAAQLALEIRLAQLGS